MKKIGWILFLTTFAASVVLSIIMAAGTFGASGALISALLFPVAAYAYPIYAAVTMGGYYFIFPVVFYVLQIIAFFICAYGYGSEKLPGGIETEDEYEARGFGKAAGIILKTAGMILIFVALSVFTGAFTRMAILNGGITWLLPVAVIAAAALVICVLMRTKSDSRYNIKNRKKRDLIIAAVLALVFTVSAYFGYDYFFGPAYSSYDLSKYVKVGQYKGLEKEQVSIKVKDSEVKEKIDENLKAAATTEETEKGKVEKDDTVNIDYTGKINGKKFDGGSAEGYSLTIGSGTFIDGFEDGLVGKKIGDTVSLDLTFPEDYSDESVAGRDVVFKVTINSKEVTVVPELNEEFVKENSDSHTVKEYRKEIKDKLYKQKEKEADEEQKTKLWNRVVEDSEVIKYPKREMKSLQNDLINEYKDYAKQYEMEFKDFLEQYAGIESVKEFKKQAKEYAGIIIKEEMVLYYIADKEDIIMTGKEYDSFVTKTLKTYGYTREQFQEAQGQSYEEAVGKSVIERQIYMEKVKDFIFSKAKIKEEE